MINKEKKLALKKERAAFIIKELKKMFPNANMVLNYSNNWELLVAVALSAQCTDVQVNKVTAKLFEKYKTLDDYVNADIKVMEQDIRSTGFYRNKSKNLLAGAKVVKNEFGGKIPKTIKELITIPGVGRKTANIILGNAHGMVEGIAVDTHVKRLAQKLGLSINKTPEKIERDLMEIIPKNEWFKTTYLLIDYGRAHCIGRKHDHEHCPLTRILDKFDEKHRPAK